MTGYAFNFECAASLKKYVLVKLGRYVYTTVNCIHMDCNEVFCTNGTVDCLNYGIAEGGYCTRSKYLGIRHDCLWKTVYEAHCYWPLLL